MCFNVPTGLSMKGKMVYVLLSYTFLQAVAVSAIVCKEKDDSDLAGTETGTQNVLSTKQTAFWQNCNRIRCFYEGTGLGSALAGFLAGLDLRRRLTSKVLPH